jgi:hypothetical protein
LWALERKCNETLKLLEGYDDEAGLDVAAQKVLETTRTEIRQEAESIRKEYVDEMELPWLRRAGVKASYGPPRRMV